MTSPTGGRDLLDLRIDIDPRYPNSPVLDRVSGDFYQANRLNLPGEPPTTWRVYRESWIVNQPRVTWTPPSVEIQGEVTFWKSIHPPTTLTLRISWDPTSGIGPAEVTFERQGGPPSTFSCSKRSDSFRQVQLEVAVCQSVNRPPILPVYDTGWHPNRPSDLPARALSIEEAYRESGVLMTVRPERKVIDDSAADFQSWTDAELHHALEEHFSQAQGVWPNWELWGLLAGTYVRPTVGGIMFDAAVLHTSPEPSPDRRGFAVFRNHPWFNDLADGTPATPAQADALRKFLYTWVHEAGHAFNFLHSWDKNRPDALSWMNYDWRYDRRNGSDTFWSKFRFQFDTEELIHLRHGNRPSVIMGGDPWSSGGHAETPPGAEYLEAPPGALSQVEGSVPVEVTVRSQGYFEFMEPVLVELRIRNLLRGLPLTLNQRLNPEYGGVTFYIRRPDGRIVEYTPILCKVAEPETAEFRPRGAEEGEERHSEAVFLSYGKYGFYIDEPGEYWLRALYHGPGDVLIPSNIHRLRVGNPRTQEQDAQAQDYFSYQVGMNLYLYGSRSPWLAKGRDVLEDVAERYGDSMLGVRVRAALANSLARPFYGVQDGVIQRIQDAAPEEALRLIDPAVRRLKREKSPALNLTYRHLAEKRAELRTLLGQIEEARRELATLRRDLEKLGVNRPVLEEIRAEETRLKPEAETQA